MRPRDSVKGAKIRMVWVDLFTKKVELIPPIHGAAASGANLPDKSVVQDYNVFFKKWGRHYTLSR